jgi:hypothetical protein
MGSDVMVGLDQVPAVLVMALSPAEALRAVVGFELSGALRRTRQCGTLRRWAAAGGAR